MFLFCVDKNKQPMRMLHPAKARKMQENGEAKMLRRFPSCLIINAESEFDPAVEYIIKLDPGSQTTGLALIEREGNVDKIAWACHIQHRQHQISMSLMSRSALRRGRRSRKTRYRKCRFDRGSQAGWLPPSILSNISHIETFVRRIMSFCNVKEIHIEHPKFDAQKQNNPDIKNEDYNKGELLGYKDARDYLIKNDNQCAICGSKKQLTRDHLVPKSKGGSDSLKNAILLCRNCNIKKGNKDINVYLKDKPEILENIKKQSYNGRSMGVMNMMRYALPERLIAMTNLRVYLHDPRLTKQNRDIHFGGKKDHWIDAACVGNIDNRKVISYIDKLLVAKAIGHGCRQMTKNDKFGFPNGKAKSPNKDFDLRTGDYVKATKNTGKRQGVYYGRVTTRSRPAFTVPVKGQKPIEIHPKNLEKIHSNDGFNYEFCDVK